MRTGLLFVLLSVGVYAGARSLGQNQPVAAKATAPALPAVAEEPVEIPTHRLEFKAGDPLSTVPPTPLAKIPTQCTADGTLFIDQLKVSAPSGQSPSTERTVYSVKARESQVFSASAIGELHEVQVIDIFPSHSMVAFLVNATKEASDTTPAVAGPDGKAPAKKIDWSKRHFYIAKFDLDGSYKESVELPMRYSLFHLAVLSSGEFVVSGFDHINGVPRVVVLGSKGDLARTIELPSSIPSNGGASGPYGSFPGMVASSRLLSSLTFTSFGDDVLLWRMGGTDPVLEIGDGGSVRTVPVHLPKGYVLQDMVPANDRWIARFRPAGWNEAVAHDASESIYYEVRPSDGSLSAKLTLAGKNPGWIACESDGTYLVYDPNADGKFVRFTAN